MSHADLDFQFKQKEGKIELTESQRLLAGDDKDYIEKLLSTNQVRRQTMGNQSNVEDNPLLRAATQTHFEQTVRRATTHKKLADATPDGITEDLS